MSTTQSLLRRIPVPLPVAAATRISVFMDHSGRWTLESASAAGLVRLLDRLASREWADVYPEFRRLRFHHAISEAATKGDLRVLQWWTTSYLREIAEPPNYHTIFERAVWLGHVHILRWMKQQDLFQYVDFSMEMLCHVSSVLHEQHIQSRLLVYVGTAASEGDLEFLQWIAEREELFVDVQGWWGIGYQAALKGRLSVLQWIHANRPQDFVIGVFKGAIEGEHLDVIQWVDGKSFAGSPKLFFDYQIKVGGVEVTQCLLEQFRWPSSRDKCEWIRIGIKNAAEVGNLDVVKLLFQNHYESSTYSQHRAVAEAAARGGHLHVLQWLHEQNAPCPATVMDEAAHRGHLEVVQWLFKHRIEGCTHRATMMAALYGRLSMVQWLFEHNLGSIDTHVMSKAIHSGNLELVQFLHSQVKTCRWWRGSEMQVAASHGYLSIVEWLYFNDLGGYVDLNLVASNGHTHVAQFLALHCNLRFTAKHALSAARFGHFALLEWLLQQDAPTMESCDLSDALVRISMSSEGCRNQVSDSSSVQIRNGA